MSSLCVSSAAIVAGFTPSVRLVCSSSSRVVTVQASGGVAAETSNTRVRGAAASAVRSSPAAGTTRRNAGKRSSAANPAAAKCAQAVCRQLQRMPKPVRLPRADGSRVAVRRTPASATAAVIDAPDSATSTAPNSTSVRARVSVRGSNTARRSSAENGVGMQR
jgi:hypothetical protein